jgi:hypothetical protein
LSIVSVENVAMPPEAGSVFVPLKVPGPLASAIVIVFVAVVTVLPCASCTATSTPGARGARSAVVAGWTMKPSFVAAPGDTSKPVLVALVRPGEVAVSR